MSVFHSKNVVSVLLVSSVATVLFGCGGGVGESPSVATPAPSAPTTSTPPPSTPPEPEMTVEFFARQSVDDNQMGAEACDGSTSADAAFSDITASAGLCYETRQDPEDSLPSRVAGGIAVSDINNDGRWDIYVTQGRNTAGKLFTLSSEFKYQDVTVAKNIVHSGTDHSALFFDIDQDGLQDLISVQEAPSYLQVFRNTGDGSFVDVQADMDIQLTKDSYTVSAGDPDLDGDLDLFFAHWGPDEEQDRWEFLWRNLGDGKYEDASYMVEVGKFSGNDDADNPQIEDEFSFTPIFADINDDRYPDLLIASDWNTSQALINNAGTELIDSKQNVISDRAGMGAAVADYDNDGDLDWFVSAIGDIREQYLHIGLFDGNRLYQNDGDGNFTDVTDVAGVRQGYWGWGSCFADFNNDGHVDLFVVNGFDGMTEEASVNGYFEPYRHDRAVFYVSNGDGTFTEQSAEVGINHTLMGRGLACFDYEKDGDVDILIANSGLSPSLFRNNNFAEENNFINVRLQCGVPNPECVGARVYVTTGELVQVRELQKGNNYVSQNPVNAHFGLGDATQVDEIRVVWPGIEAEENSISNVEPNQFLVLHRPE